MSDFTNLSIDSGSSPGRVELSANLVARNTALEAGLKRALRTEDDGSIKKKVAKDKACASPKEVCSPYFPPKKHTASASFYLHEDKNPSFDTNEDNHANIANMLEQASAVALAIDGLSKEEEEVHVDPPKKKRRFERRNSVVLPQNGRGGTFPMLDNALKLTYNQSSQNPEGPLGLPKRETALVFQRASLPWRAKDDETNETPRAA